MVKISNISARQVLDSRGNPTVEATIQLGKSIGSAIVPSGASTGVHEALELRDGKTAFGGKGVTQAVKNVHVLAKKLAGKNFTTPKDFDEELLKLDGTVNKAKYGENAILSLSMAYRRALAEKQGLHLYEGIAAEYGTQGTLLPMPFSNVINGGVHAGNELEMQEFMIVPHKAKSFAHATQMVAETYHELKKTIAKKYGKNATNVGDEGGFAPPVKDAHQALDLLTKAIDNVGYNKELSFAMDPASSEFYNAKSKTYLTKKWSADKLQSHYEDLIKTYPIISLEDPFEQDDFAAWQSISKSLQRKKLQIVGDDLTVTNPARVELAIQKKMCDALLLKINQIGTITESMRAASLAESDKWNIMVSHRSGETEDPFIADLAVGMGSGQIKLGAPCRSDRVAKYNQLLRIEEALGKKAKMSKW
jgi:enolase